MDRSFLSKKEVIEASRAFICVRLATYEDQDEAAFLKALVRTKSGELENSVFAYLAPDGKTKLARAGRSPRSMYSDAAEMAKHLKRLAAEHTPTAAIGELPLIVNVRLAIDIAAADNRPLVILTNKGQKLEAKVAKTAWLDAFVGRFVYVKASSDKEMSAITEAKADSEILVVEPDQFGLKGKVLALGGGDQLEALLRSGLEKYARPATEQKIHVRSGRLQGVFWETKIPVTDPEELAARQKKGPKR